MNSAMNSFIIGLDPGSRKFGVAVLDSQNANKPLCFEKTIVLTSPKLNLSQRLLRLYDEIGEIIQAYPPSHIAIEEVFFHKNPKSAFILAHARAIGLLLAGQNNATLKEYAPKSVKLAVTGKGNASKEMVRNLVKKICKLGNAPLEIDSSDAIAIALCCYYELKNPLKTSQTRTQKTNKKSKQWSMETILKKGLKVKRT